jgi:outer membrane biosynthesis protein TonB
MKNLLIAGAAAGAVLLGGAAVAAPAADAAPVKAGKVCKTKGKKVVRQGTVYKCKRYGKVRVWVAVRILLPEPKPTAVTPRPTVTPKPAPSKTPAPKPSASQTPAPKPTATPEPTTTPTPEQTTPPSVPVVTPTPKPTPPAPETITVKGRGEAYCPTLTYEPVSWKFLPMDRHDFSYSWTDSEGRKIVSHVVRAADFNPRDGNLGIGWTDFYVNDDGSLTNVRIGANGNVTRRVRWIADGPNGPVYRVTRQGNGFIISGYTFVEEYTGWFGTTTRSDPRGVAPDPYSDIEVTCERTDW